MGISEKGMDQIRAELDGLRESVEVKSAEYRSAVDARNVAILRAYTAGVRVEEIAKLCDVTRQTVWKIVHRARS